MHEVLKRFVPELTSAIAHYQDELFALRVGRANPAMVENLLVEAYGAKTPLKQVASISAPEARTLLIVPWDKSISKDIEKAIQQANIGLNPVNEGHQLRIPIPQLTEESRRDLIKTMGDKMEKARVVVRQIRDKARELVMTQQRSGELTEDDKYLILKQLDEQVKQYTDQIGDLSKKKEEEIMTL